MSENSCKSKSSIEAEYNEINQRDCWSSVFQEIREKSDKEAKEKHFSISESANSQNRILNRYRDVNPYDHSRIIIHRGKIDYINANLVKLERADRKYILTQGPLKETVGHFWLMIYEQNTKAILMLNKLIEKRTVKCHMYWPEKIGEEHMLQLTDVGLTVEYLKCEEYTNFSKRLFRLTDTESKKSREIIQFHYTTWPDFGVPSSPVAFLQFLKQVRDSGALNPDVGPAVVHCSAGIGRSGTFCLVDCCLVLIDKEGENKVSVQDVLYELRRYRMGLIQTSDQLYFSYQAIIEGMRLLKDKAFNDYDEIPIIPKNEQLSESFVNKILDETPPPLPPRTHSLQPIIVGLNNKPLPTIPNSESFNDDIMTANNFNEHDAINNFINSEKNSNSDSIYRPLPPIPKQDSLDKVNESDSDENEMYEEDSDEGDELEDDYDAKSGSFNNDTCSTEKLESSGSLGKRTNDSNASDDINPMSNGNILDLSASTELKRRKRVERQANIEQKVNDIKRKQRELEEGEKTAKKRRSLVKYLAAGVFVGVLCVYAYAKFG